MHKEESNRGLFEIVLLSVCALCAVFEQYQKSRMQFVQTVADLAARPQNIEILQNTGEKLEGRQLQMPAPTADKLHHSPFLSSSMLQV